ncbi:MAG TPA: O-antigen ligase family protein [Bacillota bacterium]|nr:O-antigen ligase family protein [Bacillota bacterium]
MTEIWAREKKSPVNTRVSEILLLLCGACLGIALALPEARYLVVPVVLLFLVLAASAVLTDPQRSLWLVVSYVLVDYVLRKIGLLSGSWDELTFVMIVGLWIVKMAWENRASYRLTPLDMYLGAFLAICVFLLLMRSPDMSIAIKGLRAVVEYLFWFFVASNVIKSGKQVRFLVTGFLVLATLISLHGIYQYIVGVPIDPKWIDQAESGIKTRVFSIIGSPNILGSFLILSIPITVSLFFASRSWLKKLLYTGVLGLMGLCLLFTYSRGAWIALVLAMFYYGVVHNRKLLALIVIASILAPIAVPSVGRRVTYLLSPEYVKSSQKGGRLVRWTKAINIVKKSPVVGVGLGRYGGAVATNAKIPGTFYVDNYYLKTLAEMGILGLAAMLWLFLNCMRFGTNAYRRAEDPFLRDLGAGIMAGLLGLLIHNGVENVFEVPMINSYFWFFLGMVGTFPLLRKTGQADSPVDGTADDPAEIPA